MPDAIPGERVCVFVIPRGSHAPTLEEIVSFLRAKQIAPYKLPERLEIVESFPMVSHTKVNKRLLMEKLVAKVYG